jgi:hypothetical protein
MGQTFLNYIHAVCLNPEDLITPNALLSTNISMYVLEILAGVSIEPLCRVQSKHFSLNLPFIFKFTQIKSNRS